LGSAVWRSTWCSCARARRLLVLEDRGEQRARARAHQVVLGAGELLERRDRRIARAAAGQRPGLLEARVHVA